MNETTIRKYRWFWAWQDEQEEAWLTRMSREKGWHLAYVRWPGFYTFTVGEPRDYVYRLDYRNTPRRERPAYFQLFADAGWAHIAEFNNWQYFRKEARPGEAPEIFTDRQSKIDKYRRVLAIFVVFAAIYPGFFNAPVWGRHHSPWMEVLRAVLFGIMLLWIYMAVRIWRRIEALKRS